MPRKGLEATRRGFFDRMFACGNRNASRRRTRGCVVVRTAPSGSEGIAIAREWIPDVILMDLMMPGIDGYEATKILRSDPRTRFIPIIAFTAASENEARRAFEAGVDVYSATTRPITSLSRAVFESGGKQLVLGRSELLLRAALAVCYRRLSRQAGYGFLRLVTLPLHSELLRWRRSLQIVGPRW
jgi:two-component system, cell cycle response regulator DivK